MGAAIARPSMSASSQRRVIGILSVLMLHGAVAYGLWGHGYAPSPEKTVIVTMVDIPAAPTSQPQPQPQPAKAVRRENLHEAEKPAAQAPAPAVPAPAVQAAPAAASVPAPAAAAPAAPAATPEAAPAQPLSLQGELSVNCPERTPPAYPVQSLRLGEQGHLVLRVELDESGRVTAAAVRTPSGFSRLDQAALNAVRTWHCRPAMQGGRAVPAVALQPFSFTLEDR